MGFWGNKDSIAGTALGVSGALNKNKKTDRDTAFAAAIGGSLATGKKWTAEDSLKLGAALAYLDDEKKKD